MRQRFKADVDSLMGRSTGPGTDRGNSSGAEQPPRAAARASRDCVEPGGGGTGTCGRSDIVCASVAIAAGVVVVFRGGSVTGALGNWGRDCLDRVAQAFGQLALIACHAEAKTLHRRLEIPRHAKA